MFLLTIAKIFQKLGLTINLHILFFSLFTLVLHLAFTKIKCLIDRAYKINNTCSGLHDDVPKINDVLERNFYPSSILDKIVKAYINKIHYNSNKVFSEVNKLRYFKLPYIDKYSEQVQKKIAKLCKQYCEKKIK